MALTINNNSMARTSAKNADHFYNQLEDKTKKLSSGLRINSAADDAAGMAIRELMLAEGAALSQGARNARDAVSMMQTADGALQGTNKILTRMKELATQASSGTYNSTQRNIINSEYQAMAAEVTRISKATDFNGINLLDGSASGTHDGSGQNSTGSISIHTGTGSNDSQTISIDDSSTAALGLGSAGTTAPATPSIAGSSIATQSGAQEALVAIDAAMAASTKISADLGSAQNSLESNIDSNNIQALNLASAQSQISDADIAFETAQLVRTQVLEQSSLFSLSEANQSSSLVLQLISKQV